MVIRIVQAAIVAAVIASNIQWHWTPNGYIPVLFGIGAAFVLTVVPVGIFHEIKILRAQAKADRERAARLRKRKELPEASGRALRPSQREPYRVEPWDRPE